MAQHDLLELSVPAIKTRLARLDRWPEGFADAIDADPRCGCDPECAWDNTDTLDAELARRGV